MVTAHWEAPTTTFCGGSSPALTYDCYGFPRETYTIRYPAPGAPALADVAAGLLHTAGLPAVVAPAHG